MLKNIVLSGAIAVCLSILISCTTNIRKDAGVYDRYAEIDALKKRINTIGFVVTPVGPEFDEIIKVSAITLKRQAAVLDSYRNLAEAYRDVRAFNIATKGMTKVEVASLLNNMDSNLPEEKTMRKKLYLYEGALKKIENENVTLAKELSKSSANISAIMAYHLDVLIPGVILNAVKGVVLNNQDGGVIGAIQTAKKRLQLCGEANNLIQIEIKTILAVEGLEQRLNTLRR